MVISRRVLFYTRFRRKFKNKKNNNVANHRYLDECVVCRSHYLVLKWMVIFSLCIYIYIFFIDASGIDICLSTDDGGPLSGFECF